MIPVGFLDRLDDRVVGAKGQPPDPRRMRAAHWLWVTLVLVLVIAGFLSSGRGNNPVVWPLAGMALGSFIFGGRKAASARPPETPEGNDVSHERPTRGRTEADIQRLAGGIAEAEQHRE
jgi:hypothetical protein